MNPSPLSTPVSGQIYLQDGTSQLFWRGSYIPVEEQVAKKLQAQQGAFLRIPASKLSGEALNWAVAQVCGHEPLMRLEHNHRKDLSPGKVRVYLEHQTWTNQIYGDEVLGEAEFNPDTEHSIGGPLLDEHRISTEIAGDGWAALYNDCFDRQTYAIAVQGKTRLEAGLRCIVRSLKGPEVEVPAELVDADTRIALVIQS